jgi:hypothetical protein
VTSQESLLAIDQVRSDMNRLRGRLFQAVEAAGLPDKQEHALKGVIRNTTYDAQADLESVLRGG